MVQMNKSEVGPRKEKWPESSYQVLKGPEWTVFEGNKTEKSQGELEEETHLVFSSSEADCLNNIFEFQGKLSSSLAT